MKLLVRQGLTEMEEIGGQLRTLEHRILSVEVNFKLYTGNNLAHKVCVNLHGNSTPS